MGVHLQEKDLKRINGESLIEEDGGNLILPIIPEAPLDGKLYGRKDAEWSEVVVDVSGLATKVELSDGLILKADLAYVNEELDKKADKTEIPDISGLATKVELSGGLDLKANKLDVDADLLQINTEIGQVEQSLTTKIGDAPSDGKQYARQDEAWSEVIAGGSEYELPIASPTILGGIKIGDGLTALPDGTVSVEGGGGGLVESVENQNNTQPNIMFWTGTQSEYDSIAVPNPDTLYFIKP